MVINGSIAQIRSTHCIESCMSWSGKAPRRPSQIRDSCQAVDGTSDSVDGKPSHAAEVKCVSVNLDCLKHSSWLWPGKGKPRNSCGCYDDTCARTPIDGFDKAPFAVEYRHDGDSSAPVLCRYRGGG